MSKASRASRPNMRDFVQDNESHVIHILKSFAKVSAVTCNVRFEVFSLLQFPYLTPQCFWFTLGTLRGS